MKPIDISEIEKAVLAVDRRLKEKDRTYKLQAFVKNLEQQEESLKIAINGRDGREVVLLKNVIRCEADGPCTWFYLSNGRKMMSAKNLGEYDKLFPDSDENKSVKFIRVHYAHLVNLDFIHKYLSLIHI